MKRILLFLALLMLLGGCTPAAPAATPAPAPTLPPQPPASAGPVPTPEVTLLCAAADEAEAMEIAELYGIELLEYRNGLGRYRCDGDPRELIRRGRENGWPLLSLNHKRSGGI